MNSLKPFLSSADRWPLMAKPAKWLRRRLFAVSEQQVYDAVFSDEFARLQERFAEEDPEVGNTRLRDPRKYVIELRRLLQQNLRLVDHLGLYGRPPMDILDLGCGPGYFMKICEMLGHRVSGLDIDTSEMFRELIRLQNLRRFIIRIEAFTPLPQIETAPFDLITAFAICFNNHDTPRLWTSKEWAFFLDDIGRLLKSGGRLHLVINAEHGVPPSQRFYTPELHDFFLSRGARIDGARVAIVKK
ncbi:MAG: methyltransferase domain-containing protein [Verrucomicrobiota bacterium]